VARYEKARRCELIVAAPIGFVKAGDRLDAASVFPNIVTISNSSQIPPRIHRTMSLLVNGIGVCQSVRIICPAIVGSGAMAKEAFLAWTGE
jgi:hypothetical protein